MIHIIVDHYGEYFEKMGKNLKETNGEHNEALHHTLKTMQRNKGLYIKEKNTMVAQFKNRKASNPFQLETENFLNVIPRKSREQHFLHKLDE